MNDFPQKINNSYESGSSSSSASSANEQGLDKSIPIEELEVHKLASILMPANQSDLYNTSVEEGIFPNVPNFQTIQVPSYQPEYDYNIEYDDTQYSTPYVYSWLPIVPGFTQNGLDNLQHFQHLDGKFNTDSLNVSSNSMQSESISNQNIKFQDYLVVNNAGRKLLNNSHVGMELENSCNAMDLNISCTENVVLDPHLSFDDLSSKIFELLPRRKSSEVPEVNNDMQQLEEVKPEGPKNVEQLEEERLHNESFELLKKEDSSKMMYINENEKSPDLFDSEGEIPTDNEARDEVEAQPDIVKPTEDCDNSVLKKLRVSLAGLCPPPSITRHQMSLTEMLEAYNKNISGTAPEESAVTSSCFFIPSHKADEVVEMQWPKLFSVRCLDVAYNKSTASEHIEVLCLNYGQRYIGAETTSSFDHKIGPSSAKKRKEKLKLLKTSPGRRLSHLAHRRSVFSSANLKNSSLNSSLNTSQTSSSSGPILIDRKKLYAKAVKARSPKKRTSAKKKTPGKKKTPKSAKRLSLVMSSAESTSSRVSSKRALFTSPIESKNLLKPLVIAKEISTRGRLPRRSLFSPVNDENKKRRRSTSPDHDVENRGGKLRRLESPTRLPKSQSFSIAPSTSSSNLGEKFRKTLLYRTQSEMISQPGTSLSTNNLNLGYRDPLTVVVKNKILWSVSSALKAKEISKEHEKFKEHASLLAKLVKRIFLEFYNPATKSMSSQMINFANQMVFYVIQGRSFENIYELTKMSLQSKNTSKLFGYVRQDEYERNQQQNLIRKGFSFMSQSCSTLNLSQQSAKSIESLNSMKPIGSDSSLNRSSSKSNQLLALRENFISQSGEKSVKKFGGSESNLTRAKSNSSTNLMKAKRQISF